MAFSQADIDSLADDFVSVAGAEIVTPRAVDRRGGQSGFAHFMRSVATPEIRTAKKCARCRMPSRPNRRLCERHAEQALRWETARHRKKGGQPWKPGGKGRPPKMAAKRIEVDHSVSIQEVLLADALVELAAMQRRVTQLRRELTEAKKNARRRVNA